MKRFDITSTIRTLNMRVSVYKEVLPEILRPPRWWERGFPMADRVEFLAALADAKAQLFSTINATYPELKNLSYTVSETEIECEALEEPPSVAEVGHA